MKELLHKTFIQASLSIDKRIHQTLLLSCEALLKFRQLSIVSIGRALETNAKVKHAIKRVDRLFGNIRLQSQVFSYYQDMAKWIIKKNTRPIIIIDGSGLTSCGKFHFLRASVPAGGRALFILDMAFPLNEYGSQKTHKKFIKQLKVLSNFSIGWQTVMRNGLKCDSNLFFSSLKEIAACSASY